MTSDFANIFCKIYGRVQGVGFRSWLKNRALKYSLNGWVRNCPDNTVECEISGEEKNIKILLNDCKKGPIFSSVKNIFTKKNLLRNIQSLIYIINEVLFS